MALAAQAGQKGAPHGSLAAARWAGQHSGPAGLQAGCNVCHAGDLLRHCLQPHSQCQAAALVAAQWLRLAAAAAMHARSPSCSLHSSFSLNSAESHPSPLGLQGLLCSVHLQQAKLSEPQACCSAAGRPACMVLPDPVYSCRKLVLLLANMLSHLFMPPTRGPAPETLQPETLQPENLKHHASLFRDHLQRA